MDARDRARGDRTSPTPATDVEVERVVPRRIGVGDAARPRYAMHAWPRARASRCAVRRRCRRACARARIRHIASPVHGRHRACRATAPSTGARAARRRSAAWRCAWTPARPRAPHASLAADDSHAVAPSLAGVKRFRWLAVHHRLATVGVRAHAAARRGDQLRAPARLRRRRRPAPHRLEGHGAARAPHHARVHGRAVADGVRARGRRPHDDAARRRVSALRVRAFVGAAAGRRGAAARATGGRAGVRRRAARAGAGAARRGGAARAAHRAVVPVQPSLVEPDYAAAFRALAQRQRKRALSCSSPT